MVLPSPGIGAVSLLSSLFCLASRMSSQARSRKSFSTLSDSLAEVSRYSMLWASAKSSALCLRTSLFSARSILLPARHIAFTCQHVQQSKNVASYITIRTVVAEKMRRADVEAYMRACMCGMDGWKQGQPGSYLFHTKMISSLRSDKHFKDITQ